MCPMCPESGGPDSSYAGSRMSSPESAVSRYFGKVLRLLAVMLADSAANCGSQFNRTFTSSGDGLNEEYRPAGVCRVGGAGMAHPKLVGARVNFVIICSLLLPANSTKLLPLAPLSLVNYMPN